MIPDHVKSQQTIESCKHKLASLKNDIEDWKDLLFMKKFEEKLQGRRLKNKKCRLLEREVCQTIIHENSTVFIDDGTQKVEPKTITTKFNACASNLAFHTLHQEWHDKIIVSDEFKDDEIKNTMT